MNPPLKNAASSNDVLNRGRGDGPSVPCRSTLLGYLAIAITCCCASAGWAQNAVAEAPPKPSAETKPASFAGTWQTTYGQMKLAQSGNKVSGSYGEVAAVEGVVEGRKLTFTYREPTASGKGWFELSADGRSFAGKWLESGETQWQSWLGKRLAEAKPVVRNFSGLWNSTFGPVRLVQKGDQVEGAYALEGGSAIKGQIKDGKLVFKYTEPRASGEGWFQLSADKNSFAGKWRAAGESQWQPWIGKRMIPQPGKIWLVVLEAHWERGLNEREYAFGKMLRSYFTMAQARHIEVRHRYFHDEADFRRFCAEVPFLAEPVVLLISTHGTEKGIQVGGKTLGPDVIADSLRKASNLKLLHLSGCSMMNGPAPNQILERIPTENQFPISGYTTAVAWDASAIGDFVFLSMLMMHHMQPAEAARQAILVAPYLGEKRIPGAAYIPLGLKVVLPHDKHAVVKPAVVKPADAKPTAPVIEKPKK